MMNILKHKELGRFQHLTNVSALKKIAKAKANSIACNAVDKLFDLAATK